MKEKSVEEHIVIGKFVLLISSYYYLVFCLTTGPYEQDPSILFLADDPEVVCHCLLLCVNGVIVGMPRRKTPCCLDHGIAQHKL
jgi:hypothetical protein